MTPVEAFVPEEVYWDDMEEPPDGETSVTPEEREAVEPDEFWKSRPILGHLHDFARARRVGPWAVFGTALARVVAATPPMLQIPPTIGGYASLNLFVGLVGDSGDGKDIAQKVARDALDMGETHFMVAPLGSGEGLSHMFMKQMKGQDEPEMYNQSALVTIGEIDTLGALASRQSSTVASQLRQAAMGEQLGMFYVDQAKRMMVPEHKYRMCLIAGIQPSRSAVLLNDSAGGTPQRFIWLPAGDPQAPDFPPEEPNPWPWVPPDWMRARQATSAGAPCRVMTLPKVATDAIVQARLDRLRGNGEALDGHSLLTRAKVASAIGVLDGRTDITDEDWHLSGIVMAVSDTQRARCQAALLDDRIRSNQAQAHAEAEKAVVIEERVSQEKLKRVAGVIRRRLSTVGDKGETLSNLRKAVASQDREYAESAVDALLFAGEIRSEARDYHGVKSVRLYLV